MTEPTDPLPPETQRDIHELLVEIRKQNRLLKQCLFFLAGGLGLYLLMLNPFTQMVVTQIFGYALTVIIVLLVLVTAPFWVRFVIWITDRLPGFPKSNAASSPRRNR